MLPTRVARQSNGDPIEAFHREFDTALGRFFGAALKGNQAAMRLLNRTDNRSHGWEERIGFVDSE